MTTPEELAQEAKRLAETFAENFKSPDQQICGCFDRCLCPTRRIRDRKSLHASIDALAKRAEAAEQQVQEMRKALAEARKQIEEDRQCLYDCHLNHATGKVDDAAGLKGLAEYDAVLNMIHAAMAQGEQR